MTEDEAKTKWCPFVRMAEGNHDHNACNRGVPENGEPDKLFDGTFCLGSECMAWRWKTVPNPNWRPETMSSFPQPNVFSDANPQGIPSKTDGYCGLAGRP